jgi:hypothetical protein
LSLDQASSASRPGWRRYVRYAPLLFLVSVLIGAAYAGFVATHTFTFPSTTAAIVNKSYAVGFVANELTPVLTTCGSPTCFSVTSTSPVTVTASSTMTGGSGVSLTLIYVVPLTTSCSPTQPANTTGLIVIPLPSQSPSAITLSASTDYAYCIYYTSASSITAGILSINYSA